MKKKKEQKKDYKSPKMRVVKLYHKTQLLDCSSDVEDEVCFGDD